MSKRNGEDTTRILGWMTKRSLKLGRMTKRGRLANMRWRIRADDEMEEALKGSLEGLGGSWPTWEGPAGMIHPYLIFVTGATGGACVNFFCQV